MQKSEVSEIKKQLKKDNTCINRIYGCYVDYNKEVVTNFREAFMSVPEEEMFKYSEIFAKAMSGSVGKNLINLEFPIDEEKDGGRQAQLLNLRNTELKETDVAEELCEKIIETYDRPDNYLILMAFGAYDVPAKSLTGDTVEDMSENVYSFVLTMVCPVELSKAGLYFNPKNSEFENKSQDWMVKPPETAFLFPAFNDRETDIHSVLYYTKNADKIHPEVIEEILGCPLPMAAPEQKNAFTEIVEETFGKDCDVDKVKLIQENLSVMMVERESEGEQAVMDKADLKRFFESCGADKEALERFDAVYDEKVSEEEAGTNLLADNLIDMKKMEVKSPEIRITVDSKRTDLIETRIIDGVEYIAIPVTNEIEVNGIKVRNKRG